MHLLIEIVFWLAASLVVYTYAGYPLLLAAIVAVRGERAVKSASIEPSLTMIVSAYNERDVIAAKLGNALESDYPRERLQIIVVSDHSSDGTDEIVAGFAAQGVELLRMPQRSGKTAGLNAALLRARGEVVVFSDANALYDCSALRLLASNFADPAVGATTGQQRYQLADGEQSSDSENLYWRYEGWIKRLESRAGSLVGGDGAIYAIRRELYRPMADSDLSDFVNPLSIVALGYRNVYDARAFCVERGAESFDKEFRRKVRIVNRAWRAMLKMRAVLDPLRFGLFALQAWSHKVIRWWVPVFLLAALGACLLLAADSAMYRALLGVQLAFYGLAGTGALLAGRPSLWRIAYVPYYFCLINLASLRGILDYYRGRTYTTWSTAREGAGPVRPKT